MTVVKSILETELAKVQAEYLRISKEVEDARLALNKLLDKEYIIGSYEEELIIALQALYGED